MSDEEDERIVDALVARRTAGLATRPLVRREETPAESRAGLERVDAVCRTREPAPTPRLVQEPDR